MGDLEEGSDGIEYIENAIKYRVEDLTRESISLSTVPAMLT
jgi:hypothetical protein